MARRRVPTLSARKCPVAQFHERLGTSVEEMATASAAQVAAQFAAPVVGSRVRSDHITNASTYDPKTGEACE